MQGGSPREQGFLPKMPQRIHTREWPYPCPDCGHRFRQSSPLTHHRATHTGEWPYQCHDCGCSYTTNGSLRRHRASHALGYGNFR
ncbi:unnamed protein product [Caretta caretta]